MICGQGLVDSRRAVLVITAGGPVKTPSVVRTFRTRHPRLPANLQALRRFFADPEYCDKLDAKRRAGAAMLLVGNKCDLPISDREVGLEQHAHPPIASRT